jgi:hypothetical protein
VFIAYGYSIGSSRSPEIGSHRIGPFSSVELLPSKPETPVGRQRSPGFFESSLRRYAFGSSSSASFQGHFDIGLFILPAFGVLLLAAIDLLQPVAR